MNPIVINLTKRAIKSKGLKLTTRVLGKAATPITVAVTGFSLAKTYRTYMKNSPETQQITSLEPELEKWKDSISCIGREPYGIGDICSISKGGAINALGKKELFKISNTRYDLEGTIEMEYHQNPNQHHSQNENYVDPNPIEAKELITRAISYLKTTENPLEIPLFKKRKNNVLKKLNNLVAQIKPYQLETNYTPIQEQLSLVVREMVDLEFKYKSKISNLENSRSNKRFKYAALTVGTVAMGSLIGLKKK